MLVLYILAWLSIASIAQAHEMTPTYLELKNSYIDGVVTTKIELVNKRQDASYYELFVYDKDWRAIPFAAKDKIVKIEYLSREYIDIYLKQSDRPRAVYVCSVSKLRKEDVASTAISSKICSKIK